MAKRQTPEATAGTKPVATPQAVVTYTVPDKPAIQGLPAGLKIQHVGESYETGKVDAAGNKVVRQRKSFRVDVPARPLDLTGDAALAKSRELSEAIKPTAAFAAHTATIVRRYSETPGKRNKMSLTLESVQVESTIDKLAREYNLTVEEVRKRLNIPESNTSVAV